MASWLTTEECLRYAPDIKLAEAALIGAIAQAQAIAESPVGANRYLSLQQHEEVVKVPLDSKILLSRLPIVGEPVVQIRSENWEDSFGRQSLSSNWISIQPEQYIFDSVRGEITLYDIAFASQAWPVHRNRAHFGYRRPTVRVPSPQMRVQYHTGFNFSETTEDVKQLKIALAAIVKLRQSAQFQGVKLMDVKDEGYRVEYAPSTDFAGSTGKIGGSLMDEWLSIFRKYRPREFAL